MCVCVCMRIPFLRWMRPTDNNDQLIFIWGKYIRWCLKCSCACSHQRELRLRKRANLSHASQIGIDSGDEPPLLFFVISQAKATHILCPQCTNITVFFLMQFSLAVTGFLCECVCSIEKIYQRRIMIRIKYYQWIDGSSKYLILLYFPSYIFVWSNHD